MDKLKLKWVVSITICMAIFNSCSTKVVNGISSQTNKVTVDGKAEEHGEFRFYDSKTKIFYHLSNDAENLYVCLKINDRNVQQQILVAGMEVWLDTLSKAKEQIGIRYPLSGEGPMKIDGKELKDSKGKSDLRMKQTLLAFQKIMELKGFKDIADGSSFLHTPEGIKLQVDWDAYNAMIYELVIPFKNWYKPVLDKSDSLKVFTFTVNINELKIPSEPPGGFDGPPGGGNRGGGPPGGGNMGGSPPGGGMSGPPSGMPSPMGGSTEKKSLSEKFKLQLDVRSVNGI